MQLQHEFTLPIPPDQAWAAMLDVERIAPCMPGATLDHVEGDEFSGRVTLKVGPLRLTYRGDASIKEKDAAARRLVLTAAGREARGSGTAEATLTASLEPFADGTRVALLTDLALTGRPAQFGRGLVNEVAGTIIGQFAERLSEEMRNGGAARQTLAAVPDESGAVNPGDTAERPADRQEQNSLDVFSLLGRPGLVALGGVAGVILAFLLGRRTRRAPGAGPATGWPAVVVIDAGRR